MQSSITYTLGANVENLTLTGSANINGTGNGVANVITGNTGNNMLDGGGGADTLVGGLGNDTYMVDNVGDVVTEALNEGTDTVQSSITLHARRQCREPDPDRQRQHQRHRQRRSPTSSPATAAPTCSPAAAGTTRSTAAPAPTPWSAAVGNDTYVVDNAGDVVTEALNEGTDTVQSSITYTLGTNVENLTLTGSADINGTGNALDNVITGNAGVNILIGGGGNDTLDGGAGADTMRGGSGNDTYVVDNVGDVVTETSAANGIDTVQASVSYTLGANVENLTLTGGGNINGTGNGDANVLTGNAGNNILTGGGGADTLVGGGGNDTAAYTATITAASVTDDGAGHFVVAAGGSEGTDTLSGVEKIDGAGTANILLVGNGGYATIQAAINAAATGDTIMIAAGSYSENVVIDKGVTVVGLGEVTIHGTFESDNSVTGNLSDWIETHSYSAAAGDGVTIAANNVALSNINIDGFANGVRFASDVSNTSLTNVDVSNTLIGIEKSTGADINGLTVTGGSFTDGYIGIDFAKDTGVGQAGNGLATNVTISGTHFEDMTAKGIYVEALSNALITGVTMDHVGFYGAGTAFGGPALVAGVGIELNLKNGVYHDITITDFTLTDTGVSNGNGGVSHNNAAAISVKTRDDAPSNNGTPATWTGGDLVISNGTIDGTSTGVRAGETNKNVAGPPVDVTGVTVTDAIHDAQNGDVENLSQSVLTVNGTSGNDSYIAGPQTTGSIVFHGGGGVDTLTGGGGTDTFKYVVGDGADIIDGSGGINTLDYTGTASAVTVDLSQATATATGIGSLTNIQNIIGGSAGDILIGDALANKLTGGGGNDTLTGNGGSDTAVYATALTVANVVSSDTGWTVTGAAGTDTLSGIEFVEHSGGRFVLIDPAGIIGFVDEAAAVLAGAGTKTGDAFVYATPPTQVTIALSTNDDLDFVIPYDVPTTITLTGTGSAHVTTGSGADFVVTGDGVDVIHTGGGNDVVNAGGGDDEIVGGQGGGDDIYDGGDGDNTVSYPSATNSITVDLNAIDRSAQSTLGGTTIGALLAGAAHVPSYLETMPVGYAEGVDIGTDVLINIQNVNGGAGNDTIIGNEFGNTISGAGGNDNLSGGAGNDTFNYTVGDGVDTIDGGADSDTLAVFGTTGDDTIHVVTNGSVITTIEGMSPTNVESYTVDGPGQRGERRHPRLHRHDHDGDRQSRRHAKRDRLYIDRRHRERHRR